MKFATSQILVHNLQQHNFTEYQPFNTCDYNFLMWQNKIEDLLVAKVSSYYAMLQNQIGGNSYLIWSFGIVIMVIFLLAIQIILQAIPLFSNTWAPLRIN